MAKEKENKAEETKKYNFPETHEERVEMLKELKAIVDKDFERISIGQKPTGHA